LIRALKSVELFNKFFGFIPQKPAILLCTQCCQLWAAKN